MTVTWQTHWRARIAVLGSALVTLAGSLAIVAAGAGEARAAMPFGQLDPAVVSQFKLHAGTTFADNDKAITAVEAQGAVTVQNSTQVLTSGGRTGINNLCHTTGLAPSLSPAGFCWDKGDDTSNSWTDTGGWTPQGLTGSYDAQPDGKVDGRTALLASWHFSRGMQGPSPVPNEFARVSLVNAEGGQIRYNHLLLVKPTVDANGKGSFTRVSSHADGVVWYGNRVFVANGRWLQVFDLRHIWKVNSSTEAVGITGTTSSARWSNYALPMIGEYVTTSDGGACSTTTGDRPCLNSLSLDRSGQDGLVSAEFKPGAAGGRVIRWALDANSALPYGHATVGYSSPIWGMQGAATDGTDYYLAGDCPSGVGGGSGDPSGAPFSCIHKAQPNAAPHVLTTSPVYTQNLGYSPSTGRIWGLNERINSTTGARVVFSINR
ncbi:hypothetical protein J7E93_04245 [Streptomyces sp. ISL-36]|uniref:hypothetical protein n=1 Tax=Streptomyces sp. ISL-36 TaxID=2819182 RepID=UPI001BEBA16F|nr:hypothetical protein [Streptomyces sp. ISL-36]MBT2439342.1 hypothetical protein [Streptomyces sp. ISL-36]